MGEQFDGENFALVRYAGGRLIETAFNGRAASVCESGDTAAFHDGAPIHLTSTTSLSWLSESIGHDFEHSRIRANIIVSGDLVAHEEDNWDTILVGNATRLRHLAAVP